jgi:hypothetical protein
MLWDRGPGRHIGVLTDLGIRHDIVQADGIEESVDLMQSTTEVQDVRHSQLPYQDDRKFVFLP